MKFIKSNMVKLSVATAIAVGGLSSSLSAQSLEEAIKGVEVSGYVRYRFEYRNRSDSGVVENGNVVDTDGNRGRARASLYLTSPANDVGPGSIKATLGVYAGGAVLTNPGTNDGDQSYIGVESLYLTYMPMKSMKTSIQAGRDNFSSPWSVDHDSRYDGVKVVNTDIENLTLLGMYLYSVALDATGLNASSSPTDQLVSAIDNPGFVLGALYDGKYDGLITTGDGFKAGGKLVLNHIVNLANYMAFAEVYAGAFGAQLAVQTWVAEWSSIARLEGVTTGSYDAKNVSLDTLRTAAKNNSTQAIINTALSYSTKDAGIKLPIDISGQVGYLTTIGKGFAVGLDNDNDFIRGSYYAWRSDDPIGRMFSLAPDQANVNAKLDVIHAKVSFVWQDLNLGYGVAQATRDDKANKGVKLNSKGKSELLENGFDYGYKISKSTNIDGYFYNARTKTTSTTGVKSVITEDYLRTQVRYKF